MKRALPPINIVYDNLLRHHNYTIWLLPTFFSLFHNQLFFYISYLTCMFTHKFLWYSLNSFPPFIWYFKQILLTTTLCDHYVIKFVSGFLQVLGFLHQWISHDITKIFLIVALNTVWFFWQLNPLKSVVNKDSKL